MATETGTTWHSSNQLGNVICGCADGRHHLRDWVATAYKADDEEPRENKRRDVIIADHNAALAASSDRELLVEAKAALTEIRDESRRHDALSAACNCSWHVIVGEVADQWLARLQPAAAQPTEEGT